MTLQKGNTPKFGSKNHFEQSKDAIILHCPPDKYHIINMVYVCKILLHITGSYITYRVFAIQVICGSIDYLMYVCVDQLISGGVNLNIEQLMLANATQKLAQLSS